MFASKLEFIQSLIRISDFDAGELYIDVYIDRGAYANIIVFMAWRRLARNAYLNVKYVLFSFPSKLITKESIKLFTFFRFMLIKKHKNGWLAMEILSFGLFAPTGSLWVAFGFHRL